MGDGQRRRIAGTWRTCPVTIAAAAILSQGDAARLEEWLNQPLAFMDKFQSTRPDATSDAWTLWKGIDDIVFHAWADDRFIAVIKMGGGDGLQYGDATLGVGGEMPETLRVGASGRPMTELLPHPIFDGLSWSDTQEADAKWLTGPTVDIELGSSAGSRLARLVADRREDIYASAQAMGLYE